MFIFIFCLQSWKAYIVPLFEKVCHSKYFFPVLFQLKRFKELKDLISELVLYVDKELVAIDDSDWLIIDEIIKILELPFILTVKLQSNQFVIADFFAEWKKLALKLRKINSNGKTVLAQNLRSEMNEKGDLFGDNDVILSCIYLSRYQALLSASEKERAVNHLTMVSKILDKVKPSAQPTMDITDNDNLVFDNSEDEFEEQLLCQQEQERGSSNSFDIISVIRSYKPNLNRNTGPRPSTLEYWKSCKYSHPLLYRLACIVNGVPATESNVEANFSDLSHIFNKFRTRLSAEMLENILLLRLNDFL